jgi:hypothetical protein
MSTTPNNHNVLQTAVTLSLFFLPVLYLTQRQKRLTHKQKQYNAEREKERAFLHNLAKNPSLQPLRPPLPDIVRRVLQRCRFAYLSTMDVAANSSHLSLMRFTYLPEEELSEWTRVVDVVVVVDETMEHSNPVMCDLFYTLIHT